MQMQKATPVIHAIFENNLRTCTIVLSDGLAYSNLRVKWIRDIPKNEVLYMVLIPCKADVGHNLMVVFDWEAIQGYRKTIQHESHREG